MAVTSLMGFLETDLKQQTSYISVVFNMDNISEMQFLKIPMVNLENSPIYPSHYINNKIIKKSLDLTLWWGRPPFPLSERPGIKP